ncbi:MAG: hypothetical protein WD830_08020, partial [Chloroflexota bacterium]
MSLIRRVSLVMTVAIFPVACVGGQPTNPPASQSAPSVAPGTAAPGSAAPGNSAPSVQPTTGPSASLDPTLSDAGIVARVTVSNDTRGGRDGTYDVIGVAADASDCSFTFEGDEFLAVAWYDDAPNGQIHRFGVSVPATGVPETDGEVLDIGDGAVSFDFTSESGFGTTYTGAAGRENEGSSTIDVTRARTALIFDFEGVTYDDVNFVG